MYIVYNLYNNYINILVISTNMIIIEIQQIIKIWIINLVKSQFNELFLYFAILILCLFVLIAVKLSQFTNIEIRNLIFLIQYWPPWSEMKINRM